LLTAVEEACEHAETEAASRSAPSPEIADWLADSQVRGVPVAIVSNNSEAAVRTFLDRFSWTQHVAAFACRAPDDPALMKPNPFLIEQAVRLLEVPPADCLLIGDSVSDVAAARAANVPVVGFAKSFKRGAELRAAGADALVLREPA
jgi:phosphoglycolate phosphatase